MKNSNSINYFYDPLPATKFATDFDFWLFFIVYFAIFMIFG